MAKIAKKKEAPVKKERGEYEQPLKVNGTFMDIIKASVKHADKNSGKNKKS